MVYFNDELVWVKRSYKIVVIFLLEVVVLYLINRIKIDQVNLRLHSKDFLILFLVANVFGKKGKEDNVVLVILAEKIEITDYYVVEVG